VLGRTQAALESAGDAKSIRSGHALPANLVQNA
jgi:hypothetical protein